MRIGIMDCYRMSGSLPEAVRNAVGLYVGSLVQRWVAQYGCATHLNLDCRRPDSGTPGSASRRRLAFGDRSTYAGSSSLWRKWNGCGTAKCMLCGIYAE